MKNSNSYPDSLDMMALLNQLAPLHRTLASNDTDKALNILGQILPEGFIEGYQSGSKVWTWTIPGRWELESATVKANGKVLIDSSWHHLHVVNYSKAFKGIVSSQEFLARLHSNPEQPNSIPFVFDFYNCDWGFCVPHAWLNRFQHEKYEVEIKSQTTPGLLNTFSYFLPGDNPETIIVCSDICHPTQVNDSLTGVAVSIDVALRMSARPKRKYSYLFLVVPETIGSIAYLSHHPEIIINSVGGIFTEMLGNDNSLKGQKTRFGKSYWDRILQLGLETTSYRDNLFRFTEIMGNDEKVMDSPGVDIPSIALTRAPYPEYHTSGDNIELINVSMLREARDVLQSIIDIAEEDYIPVLSHPGPVFLSGHGLYPDWRSDPSKLPLWESYLKIMPVLDGSKPVTELASTLNIELSNVLYWTEAFAEKGLLMRKPFVLSREKSIKLTAR